MDDPHQVAYWNGVAASRCFTHPLDREFLAREVPTTAAVLDVGCGYGRTLLELRELGYSHVTGVDTSDGMIARGHAEHPDLDLRHIEAGPLPFPDGAFDLVLLLAVLTSIPDPGAQTELLAEVRRVLKPGGHVFVSDLMLQADARNQERYERDRETHGYGTFGLEDGGRFRHHDERWLAELGAAWSEPGLREVEIRTMNGNPVRCFQFTGRRP